ncbi:MAG: bifunctional 4-hydroxy-2-oxoglutarate aldolase/2-dehydro-3-deoxy-phosphogluconate aldolase [Limnochordia bacterium]|jgi:2-dehydro-3-deoxyphosphogluconate aldolase/(4S)-4-hydroxy-2-oxoglutarate aldolase
MQNKLYVYEKALESRVVAIMRKFDVTKVVPLARALYEGGIRAMEVTMDTVGATGAITAIRNELGDKIAVGAGTVLDGEIARIAILAGAQFLVTPNLNLDVVTVGNRYGVPAMPGVMTPTEIQQACAAGVDIVKVFPAGVLGPAFIKSIKGPLSHVAVMATGGISVDNAADFRKVGADLLGVGGNLVSAKLVAENRFDEITAYAKQLVETAR